MNHLTPPHGHLSCPYQTQLPPASSSKISDIHTQLIPSKVIPTNHSSCLPSPAWLTPQIKKKIHLRRNLFYRAKSNNSPALFSSYKRLRNQICHDILVSKSQVMNSLSSSNPRRFWSKVKSLRKTPSSIPSLKSSDNTLTSSDQDKSPLLNQAFSSSHTQNYPSF